jgi:DNA polymerase-3 subunit delta
LKTTPEKLESGLQRGLAPAYLISGDEPLAAGEAADACARCAGKRVSPNAKCSSSSDANSSGLGRDPCRRRRASLFASKRLIEVRIPGGKRVPARRCCRNWWCGRRGFHVAGDYRQTRLGNQGRLVGRSAAAGVWVVAEVSGGTIPWSACARGSLGVELDDAAVASLCAHTEETLWRQCRNCRSLRLRESARRRAEVLASVTQSSRFDVTQLG